MALIKDKTGQYVKADWIHNFEEVDQRLDANTLALANKLNSNEKGAVNGIPTLNNEQKVVETALNSDKVGGKTLAEITTDRDNAIEQAVDEAMGDLPTSAQPLFVDTYFDEEGFWGNPDPDVLNADNIIVMWLVRNYSGHDNNGKWIRLNDPANADTGDVNTALSESTEHFKDKYYIFKPTGEQFTYVNDTDRYKIGGSNVFKQYLKGMNLADMPNVEDEVNNGLNNLQGQIDSATTAISSVADALAEKVNTADTENWQKFPLTEPGGSSKTWDENEEGITIDEAISAGYYKVNYLRGGEPGDVPDAAYTLLVFGTVENEGNMIAQMIIDNDGSIYTRKGVMQEGFTMLWGDWITQASKDFVNNNFLPAGGTAVDSNQLGGKTLGTVEAERDAAIITAINNIIAGAPTAFDTLQEIATWIANDESTTAGLISAINARVQISDIRDDLTHQEAGKPLSANQGYVLKQLVDTKLASSDVVNNLTTNNAAKALSAAQGKTLKDTADALAGTVAGKHNTADFNSTTAPWQKFKLSEVDGSGKPISGEDLNDVVDPGFYQINNAVHLPDNINSDEDGIMFVNLNIDASRTQYSQLLIALDDTDKPAIWVRVLDALLSSWTAWSQIMRSGDTAQDSDALGGKSLATVEAEYHAAITAAINALVGGAPGALDTLNELAAALNDDENFAAAVTSTLADLQSQIDTLASETDTTNWQKHKLTADSGRTLDYASEGTGDYDLNNNTLPGVFQFYSGSVAPGNAPNVPSDPFQSWIVEVFTTPDDCVSQKALNVYTGQLFWRSYLAYESRWTDWKTGTPEDAADGSGITDLDEAPAGNQFIPDLQALSFPGAEAGNPGLLECIKYTGGAEPPYIKQTMTNFASGKVYMRIYATAFRGWATWKELIAL